MCFWHFLSNTLHTLSFSLLGSLHLSNTDACSGVSVQQWTIMHLYTLYSKTDGCFYNQTNKYMTCLKWFPPKTTQTSGVNSCYSQVELIMQSGVGTVLPCVLSCSLTSEPKQEALHAADTSSVEESPADVVDLVSQNICSGCWEWF